MPATSANLGPAFDCAGLALSCWDSVDVAVTDGGLDVTVAGAGAGELPTDERHLVVQAFRAASAELGWMLSELLGDGMSDRREELTVDLSQPVIERDRQLTILRREIATVLDPALEAAGLPNLAPAIAPVAGDDKALF